MAGRFKLFTRLAFLGLVLFAILVTGTFAYAKNNPDSQIAQMIPELPSINLQKFNLLQYSSPEEALIEFAKDAANGGMDGAPAQPAYWIAASPSAGEETFALLEKSAPQVGSSSTITIDEVQATSVAALVLQEMPDLPVRDVQVYLSGGQIWVWCMVDGDTNSTSALATANIYVDENGMPLLNILSAQVGSQNVPSAILGQFQNAFNRELADQINAQARGMRVTNIYIDSGVLTATVER